MMLNSILEHVILQDGVATHISGTKADAELTPPLVSIASKTATAFCKAAGIGEFDAVSGFDSRGGFVIQHDDVKDELMRTDACAGWNIRHDPHCLEYQDIVSQQFYKQFKDPADVENSSLHLPLAHLIQTIHQTMGFQLLALRHKSGQWIDPTNAKSKSKHNKICTAYYTLARILYSQDLPTSRLFIKASNGYALSWRSHDKTCGLALWNGCDDTQLTRHTEIIDGMVLAFTN